MLRRVVWWKLPDLSELLVALHRQDNEHAALYENEAIMFRKLFVLPSSGETD
jgi:hypothetical protein